MVNLEWNGVNLGTKDMGQTIVVKSGEFTPERDA